MTINEAIKSNTIIGQMPDERIELSAELRGINLSSSVTASSLKDIELITADLYSEIILSPDFSEGKLSITYNRDSLQSYIDAVAERYDDETLKSKTVIKPIVDKTDLW